MQQLTHRHSLNPERNSRSKNGTQEAVTVFWAGTLLNECQLSNQLQEGEAAFLVFDQIDGYADGLFIKPKGNNLLIIYGYTTQLTGSFRLTATFQKTSLAISDIKLEEEPLMMSRTQFARELKHLTTTLQNLA